MMLEQSDIHIKKKKKHQNKELGHRPNNNFHNINSKGIIDLNITTSKARFTKE